MTSFHRIATTTLSGVDNLTVVFQCDPELVNIFEMVPPVQRLHQLSTFYIATAFRRQPILPALGRGAIPNQAVPLPLPPPILPALGRGAIPNL